MKRLALGCLIMTLASGCSAQLLALLQPPPSQGPGSRDDCYLTPVRPAPMFHVDAPAIASAGATVSLEPWVHLSGPVARLDEVLAETFKAEVDLEAKTVTVRGSIKRYEANPESNCAFPALMIVPKAATLSIPLMLPAGSYTVAIASESFTTEHPPAYDEDVVYPGPTATRSLIVD